jgi:hypothetical protein
MKNIYSAVYLQCLHWGGLSLNNVGCEEGSCQYTKILQWTEEGRGQSVSGSYQKVTEWAVNNQLTDGGREGECAVGEWICWCVGGAIHSTLNMPQSIIVSTEFATPSIRSKDDVGYIYCMSFWYSLLQRHKVLVDGYEFMIYEFADWISS